MRKSFVPLRILTTTAIFDGHDASINIMRRVMIYHGAEVIHIGHDRSVYEIVEAAIQEDVDAIAVTSYQGGHMEFFSYLYERLQQKGYGHIAIVGGGGGTILPDEIDKLHTIGIKKIYSPNDGLKMGLDGMIKEVIAFAQEAQKEKNRNANLQDWKQQLSYAITKVEHEGFKKEMEETSLKDRDTIPILGITGTGGAGKSSLTDELLLRFKNEYPNIKIIVLSIDPSKLKTGGALLGDRIRMNSIYSDNVFMRSMATKTTGAFMPQNIAQVLKVCQQSGCDLIILETAGAGQSEQSVVDVSDVSVYVMTSEYGATTQLEKINMLDYADVVCVNKFDKQGSEDTLNEVVKIVKRQKRNKEGSNISTIPVFGTRASKFDDKGVTNTFWMVQYFLKNTTKSTWISDKDIDNFECKLQDIDTEKSLLQNANYLNSITDVIENYNSEALALKDKMSLYYALKKTSKQLGQQKELEQKITQLEDEIGEQNIELVKLWESTKKSYNKDVFEYSVRGKIIKQPLTKKTLSGLHINRVSLPKFSDYGDIVYWLKQENIPGNFPYTSGVFPLKQTQEEPKRMFAGEGSSEKTNKRFHLLAKGEKYKRLSTAFDSVTLYGKDPNKQLDIYGKIGNSGVSISTLDDMKKLYSGFELYHPNASVSMTINGPASIILAMFFNTAIDQAVEKHINEIGERENVLKSLNDFFKDKKRPIFEQTYACKENNNFGLMFLGTSSEHFVSKECYQKIKQNTLKQIRGTVQADILKEDQSQNTCIFSINFSLKLMADMQKFFIHNQVNNYYSISISGYHIAEAGANPITQLAFTLANGFTYIEYYLKQGMKVDDFVKNFSFFFSNGLDPEYNVLGRVARRIWAKALKYYYLASDKSQKLKYHVQTSGRSLHAQEIDYNDIRTTLQALSAITDNCNSLHTNAYDEAITTPTEESVRRAIAIQLIIQKEFGNSKNENNLQGSFYFEELTHQLELAVLEEFRRLANRGGVLQAMERQYQRNKIQEESMEYESKKIAKEIPIIGVNTFLSNTSHDVPKVVSRSDKREKDLQISNKENFIALNKGYAKVAIENIKASAIKGDNIFEQLMYATRYCTLQQITDAMYDIGGKYRRSN